MPGTAVRLVIDDPENFHLLTTDMKEMIIKGGIATVNVQAALTRKNAVKAVQDDFTLRNNFTTSQIQFQQMEKSRFLSLSAIQSKVGITEKAGYMARQETGGPHKAGGGSKLAIPTHRARGGNKGSPVLKNYYLYKLKKVKGGGVALEGQTYRSWLVRKAAVAARDNLVMRHNDKLFQVSNFQKSGGKVSFKMNQIYGLDREETITPAHPWLMPSAEQPARDVENIFISQMKKLGM
jgi:hypothetical protein